MDQYCYDHNIRFPRNESCPDCLQGKKPLPELIVTKGGVPFEDQAEGRRQFMEAALQGAEVEKLKQARVKQMEQALRELKDAKDNCDYRTLYQQSQQRERELVGALEEARLQIEYLQGKFAETGPGNAVLAQIDALLARKEDKT